VAVHEAGKLSLRQSSECDLLESPPAHESGMKVSL